jgi:uncharacterized protein (TIGR04255 family)
MNRSRPALLLKNSPLLLTLAQVRISPVLQMRSFVPEIQERLRKSGYPRYAESQTQEIVLTGGPEPKVNLSSKWVFGDRDLRSAVVVAPEFVALETVAYETFDAFVERMANALRVVGEVVQVDLAERLGLRYLDYVRPLGNDTMAEYLSPGLLGIGGVEGLGEVRSQYLAQGQSDLGRMMVRVTRGAGPFRLPPDLQPLDLALENVPDCDDWALLDFDHFSEMPRPYNVDAIADALWGLHDLVDATFRNAATAHAFAAWGAEEVPVHAEHVGD